MTKSRDRRDEIVRQFAHGQISYATAYDLLLANGADAAVAREALQDAGPPRCNIS